MSKETVMVLMVHCTSDEDYPTPDFFVITLTQKRCKDILKLMQELKRRRKQIDYFEAHRWEGAFGEVHYEYKAQTPEELAAEVDEHWESTECRIISISDTSVCWKAFLKHTDPPVRIESDTVSYAVISRLARGWPLTEEQQKEITSGLEAVAV